MLRFSNPNLTALGGRVNMSQTLAALGYVPGGGGGGTVDSVARAAAAAAQTTANTAVGVAGVAQTTATSALSASTTNTNALANLQSPLAPGQLGAYADVSTPSYLTSLWAWVSAGKIDTAAALTTATTANTAAGTAYTYAGTAYTLATTANTNAGAAATAASAAQTTATNAAGAAGAANVAATTAQSTAITALTNALRGLQNNLTGTTINAIITNKGIGTLNPWIYTTWTLATTITFNIPPQYTVGDSVYFDGWILYNFAGNPINTYWGVSYFTNTYTTPTDILGSTTTYTDAICFPSSSQQYMPMNILIPPTYLIRPGTITLSVYGYNATSGTFSLSAAPVVAGRVGVALD